MKLRLTLALTLLATLTLACGKAAIGEQCDSTDDCESGLECILKGSQDIGANGLECTSEKLCSKPCATDTDCSSLGSGLICLSDCNDGSCLKGSH